MYLFTLEIVYERLLCLLIIFELLNISSLLFSLTQKKNLLKDPIKQAQEKILKKKIFKF